MYNSYVRADSAWYLWRNILLSSWVITEELGVLGSAYWLRLDLSKFGVYSYEGTATGIATISES